MVGCPDWQVRLGPRRFFLPRGRRSPGCNPAAGLCDGAKAEKAVDPAGKPRDRKAGRSQSLLESRRYPLRPVELSRLSSADGQQIVNQRPKHKLDLVFLRSGKPFVERANGSKALIPTNRKGAVGGIDVGQVEIKGSSTSGSAAPANSSSYKLWLKLK